MKHEAPVEIEIRVLAEKSSKYKYACSKSCKSYKCCVVHLKESRRDGCDGTLILAGIRSYWWRGGSRGCVRYDCMPYPLCYADNVDNANCRKKHASQAVRPWKLWQRSFVDILIWSKAEQATPGHVQRHLTLLKNSAVPFQSFQEESVQLRRPWQTHMWQRVFLLSGTLLQLVIGLPARSGIKDKFCIGVQRLWFSLLSVLLWLGYILKFTAGLRVSLYIILHISNWGLFRFSQVQ